MSDDKEALQGSFPAPRWQEAAERLRSTARVFVVSLGTVAVTVVAGLSLTGLGTLDPGSENFNYAVAGALLATLGVVVMLALAMRLASATAVSMGELLALIGESTRKRDKLLILPLKRHLLKPGIWSALRVVDQASNGGLAGYPNLGALAKAAGEAYAAERELRDAAAAKPGDTVASAEYEEANRKAEWYKAQLRPLIGVASIQRLRWNFGATAAWMTVAGFATAIGIVMYAAALQPRGVPSSPVPVTTYQSIQVRMPESAAAAALYRNVVGCGQKVNALVLGVGDARVSAITIPQGECRSVRLTAAWDGTDYVAKFDLPEETETPASSATP
jgi:hypothetical protein